MRVVVVGGGIAGLATARRLESLTPDIEVVIVERTEPLGGTILVLLAEHSGLALAGAASRGVGVPDCIRSGEGAAESVARALARVRS